jgi:hypothetical protein
LGLVVLYLAGAEARAVPADARGWRRRGDVVRGDAPWVKLGRRAERARAALLVVADRPLVGTLGAVALATERGRGRWLGGGAAPRLLDGVSGRIAVVRNKLGPAAGSAELPLVVDVSAPADATDARAPPDARRFGETHAHGFGEADAAEPDETDADAPALAVVPA